MCETADDKINGSRRPASIPMSTFAVPHRLRASSERWGSSSWLDGLDERIETAVQRWSLTVREPFEGSGTGWVAPVVRPDGSDAVLKVAIRTPESEFEAEGLRAWEGHGAVRVFDFYKTDDACVLLLERCFPGTMLKDLAGESEQDEIIASAFRELWSASVPQDAPRLADLAAVWSRETDVSDDPIADEARRIFAELPRDATDEALLATDLHAYNVLRADRRPWLVIDPKPFVGDRSFDPVQHLLNCPDRLAADPVGLTHRVASLCEVDVERLRLWLFARCVSEFAGESFDAPTIRSIARRLAP
jgi:streptomycin 6-kinase